MCITLHMLTKLMSGNDAFIKSTGKTVAWILDGAGEFPRGLPAW